MLDASFESNVPRLHDWFGVWAMRREEADELRARIESTDWLAHFTAFAKENAKLESSIALASGEGGKSVAVIPIIGTMMKGRSSMGGTSTVQTRRDLRQAANDPNVSGILLSIDSPGGTVAGTEELAAEVKATRRRKPVFAQVNDLSASAAYWVASQAGKVFANSATALIGSIGAMLMVRRKDASSLTAEFTSAPLKNPDPDSDEGKAALQGLVNGWHGIFTAAVKSGRRMTDAQLERAATGAVFLAGAALDLKLIDGIQSQETTLAQLAGTR